MLNAFPNQAGTHNGAKVPIQPTSRNITKSGTMTTGNGIIIVASIAMNAGPRPRQRTREKP